MRRRPPAGRPLARSLARRRGFCPASQRRPTGAAPSSTRRRPAPLAPHQPARPRPDAPALFSPEDPPRARSRDATLERHPASGHLPARLPVRGVKRSLHCGYCLFKGRRGVCPVQVREPDFGTLVSIGGRESPKARGLVQIPGDAMAEAMAEKRPCTLRLYAPLSGSETEKGFELSFKIATPALPQPQSRALSKAPRRVGPRGDERGDAT